MNVIERIKTELLIPDILPEAGGQKVIRCPFPDHDDSTPSFHHYAESNSFYCFGCQRGGSVIDFLIHLNGWSTGEAIKHCKERLGISDHELTAEEVSRQEKLHQREGILGKITEHCFEALWSDKGHPEVAKAIKYIKDRGWSEDLLKSMRIGFIDIKEIRKISSKEDLELAGLLVRGKGNKLHPLISVPRIWYPVISRRKVLYGVCGTFLKDDPRADKKYLNLASGPRGVGSKELLYNEDAIYNRGEIFVCEGIPDTLTALSLDLNAAGLLGAGNCNPGTFRQVRCVTLIPDNDDDRRGYWAMIELAMEIFKAQDEGDVYILQLPEKEWRKSDSERFNKAQHQALQTYGTPQPKPEDFGGPIKIKDLNDWSRLGYTRDDLDKLIAKAEPIIEHYVKYLGRNVWNSQTLETKVEGYVYPLIATRGPIVQDSYKELLARPREKGGLGISKTTSNRKLKEITDAEKIDKLIPGDAASSAELIDHLRSRRGQFTEYELNKRATDIILTDILKRGKLYTDTITGQTYLFFEEKKSLIEVSRENLDFCALLDSYNVACSDKMSIHIEEAFQLEARENGHKTPIYRFCYYDEQKDTVYIAARQGCMYRISGEDCDPVDVGMDDILILPEEGTEPVEISDVLEEGLYEKVILDPVTFQPGVLSSEEQRILLDLYVLSVIFASIMPTRPILTLVGEKGSRKSSTLRKIARLFFGANEDVHLLPKKEDGFVNLVSNRHFVAIDNVDTRCDWLDDLLAVSATGGKQSRRKLYTDNTLLEFPLRAFVTLASRDPHFRRDDVADRLLILHLFKPEKGDIIPEGEIAREVVQQRAKLWRGLVARIQDMIRALKAAKQGDLNEFTTPFRMADFGTFAVKWARYTGREKEVRCILAKMSEEQVNFTLEENILYSLFEEWIRQDDNEGKVTKSTDLYRELKRIAESQDTDWPFKNTRSFGKYLARLVPSLKHEFTVDVEEKRHVKTYLFYRRETVEKGEMQHDSDHSREATPF